MSHSVSDQPSSASLASVRWAQTLPQGALVFELRSSDANVLARAEQIFSPYRGGGHPTATPFRSFQLEPYQAEDGVREWMLRSDEGAALESAETQSCAMLALALANVEFAAVYAAAEYATIAAHVHLEDEKRVVGLHGALLHRGGKGVLIVGVHEAGKSTLACGLWQTGWTLLSDDYALLAAETPTEWLPLDNLSRANERGAFIHPLAHAISRRVSLRPTSRALLGEVLWQRVLSTPASDQLGDDRAGRTLFHPHQVDDSTRLSCVPLHAIVLLQRPEAVCEPGEARRLDASRALFALLPHCGLSHRNEVGSALRVFGPIVGQVPTFDMRRGSLPAMIENLNRVLDTV